MSDKLEKIEVKFDVWCVMPAALSLTLGLPRGKGWGNNKSCDRGGDLPDTTFILICTITQFGSQRRSYKNVYFLGFIFSYFLFFVRLQKWQK